MSKVFATRLPEETIIAIKHVAVDLDREIQDVVDEALIAYIKLHPPKAAMASWLQTLAEEPDK